MGKRVIRLMVAVVMGLVVVQPIAPPAQAEPADPVSDCPPVGVRGERAVVRLAYVQVLGRCPDAGGYTGWVAALDQGLAVDAFAQQLAHASEARGLLVDDAYETVLGRSPDPGGRNFWVARLGQRVGYGTLLADLASSAEFISTAGPTSAAVVDAVYQAILDRPAEPEGRAFWAARLDAGESPRSLVTTLARLPEPLGVIVADTYRSVLDRGPIGGERNTGAARLASDGDRSALVARLVATPEFEARAERVLAGPPPEPGVPPSTDGPFVAMGDSYASGEGNPPYQRGTDEPDAEPANTCHRSGDAYAPIAANQSPAVPGGTELVACSGAEIPDFYRSGEDNPAEPPQLDALGGTPPELVSVMIGGNDIGFVPILTACLQVETDTGQLNPDYSDEACDRQLDEIAPAKITELTTGLRDDEGEPLVCGEGPCSLPALFDDIAIGAPGAEVAVVGYPPPLPPETDGDCAGTLRFGDGTEAFDGARWNLAEEYVDRLRGLFTDLNAALRDAADDAGSTYVDSTEEFAGHSVCSDGAFLYGLRLERGELAADSASFHPTVEGQQALADALLATREG